MSSRFDILDTALASLRVLQRNPIGDNRGFLERLFCIDELQTLAPHKHIAQINQTLTALVGTVRGMHFQCPPHAEIKFVSCLRGEVFDVAVDLRHNSPTFLHWHAEVLSERNRKTLVIPEGFAHGFQTLTDNCEMLYFHTHPFHPEAEGGLNPQDPSLAITWPLAIAAVSDRDAAHPMLNESFSGMVL